ncbi:argus isoform 3-T3 [Cochliomyia hominivorax]
MDSIIKNSKHATTSLEGTTTATMTATQMRATLIYLAPFLQPCKNVVTSTSSPTIAQTTTTRAQSSMTQQLQQSLGNEQQDIATITTTATKVIQQQQTHVARNRLNSNRNNHNNAISSNSSRSRPCCSNTATNMITSKECNVCEVSGSSGKSKSSSCNITTTGSSCCHNNINNTMQQQQQKQQQQLEKHEHEKLQIRCEYQKEKQVKEQNFQQKDKYYKNYEMPALETTTTIKTRQTQQHQQQEHLKTSLLINSTSLSSTSLGCSSSTTNSFVNYTNNRTTASSTKYLRERGRRQEQTLKQQKTYGSLLKQQQQQQQQKTQIPLMQQNVSYELKTKKTTYENNLQRNLTCGRGPSYDTKDPQHYTKQQQHGFNINNNNTSVMSRCHCLNYNKNNNNDNIQIMLSNVQDMKQQQQQQHLENMNILQTQTNCDDEDDVNDHLDSNYSNNPNNETFYNDNHYSENIVIGELRLRKTHKDIEDEHDEEAETENEEEEEEEEQKNSYINYNANNKTENKNLLFFTNSNILNSQIHSASAITNTNTNTTTATTTQQSFLSTSTTTTSLQTLQTSSLSSATLLNNPSYTTTLNKNKNKNIYNNNKNKRNKSNKSNKSNKECRCFKQFKRDTIGSECNLKQKNFKLIEESAAAATGTGTGHRDNYCLINDSDIITSSSPSPSTEASVSVSSSTVCKNLSQLVLHLSDCLMTLVVCSKLNKTVAVSKWLFMWLLFIMLSTSAHCWAGRNDVPTNCTFPARWEGSWFLSGYQQSIHIKGSQFSYRGRCAASDGNKYLIVDEKGCHRCLVIYEKHNNVLQYKESECEGDSMYMHQTNPSAMAMRSVLNQKTNNNGGDHRGGAHPNLNGHSRLSSSDQYIMRSNDDMNDYFCKGRETLQNLCDQIPGDALLYSLFRESAEPVKCPLKGPFVFTYNRGNGECKSPVSNIESCTEDSRLLLSFQACPDVVGTESTVEELTCLATWKDGNSRYLVGLVSHHHAISNEERYRCFVYEKISSLMDLGHFAGPSMSTSKDAEYKLAQSGDATCNGLDSAEVGSRIMSLRKPPVTERCDFPVWFKGPRHWHVLMGNMYKYHSDGSIHIIKPNGYMETRALCEQINKQTATEMMSVVHYTTGCQSGFMCMVFYRRDTHIIEIQTGKPASRLEDACAPDHFDINKTPFITLLASNPDPQICPMEGLYTLRGAIGPPYLATRHKRNHNKVHGLHNHHHQYEGNGGREYLHKRHSSLSFRNSQHDEKNAWHSNTRGLPVRSRRDASSTVTPLATLHVNQTEVAQTTQKILVVGNNTNVGFVKSTSEAGDGRLRSRRNVPECITNFKAQRQLWIGCTEENIIDVRPMCNDEGEEEYSCYGSWTENGTVFIIARNKNTKHGVCITYRPTEGTSAKLVVGDACYRGTQKPPEHHLVANLSVFGKCGETGSTSSSMPIICWFNLLMATILITFLSQLPIQR